ncbi:MAG: hypothetical protein V1763_01060 [Parcubacteria group bacterium]
MDDLKELLRKNFEQITDIQKKIDRIHHYMVWQVVWSVFKFVIIIVPLVWGIILAAPHVRELFSTYSQMSGALKAVSPGTTVLNPADLLRNFVK